MIRIAICDDDVAFTGKLEEMLVRAAGEMGVPVDTDVYFDGKALLEGIRVGNHYDLIFIDIVMEHVDGIAAARRIRETDRSVLFIYVSCYEQYLKELFEVEPFRFLGKPLNEEQVRSYFREACQRIGETEVYYEFCFNKEIRKAAVRDIVYFESRKRVIHIFLKDGTQEVFYGKLDEVEDEMRRARKYFLRIHQSYLVNYIYVRKINYSSVTLAMEKQEDIVLKISEDRQRELRTRLGKIVGGRVIYNGHST